MTLVCQGYRPEVREWLNVLRIALVHKGVRFCSISFVIKSVEQLFPFLSCLVAFVSSASVIGSFKMLRSGGCVYCSAKWHDRLGSCAGLLYREEKNSWKLARSYLSRLGLLSFSCFRRLNFFQSRTWPSSIAWFRSLRYSSFLLLTRFYMLRPCELIVDYNSKKPRFSFSLYFYTWDFYGPMI